MFMCAISHGKPEHCFDSHPSLGMIACGAGYLRFMEKDMRFNLKVPFAEKDQAKKLGARWDAGMKVWYVGEKADLALCAKWSPTPHDVSSTGGSANEGANKAATRRHGASGKVIVGADFVEFEPECDCLPWESCSRCEAGIPGK